MFFHVVFSYDWQWLARSFHVFPIGILFKFIYIYIFFLFLDMLQSPSLRCGGREDQYKHVEEHLRAAPYIFKNMKFFEVQTMSESEGKHFFGGFWLSSGAFWVAFGRKCLQELYKEVESLEWKAEKNSVGLTFVFLQKGSWLLCNVEKACKNSSDTGKSSIHASEQCQKLISKLAALLCFAAP